MPHSYQKEVPKGRINLYLEVDQQGASKKVELPMKMLVLGDFSNGKAKGDLTGRKRYQVARETVDGVMQELQPAIKLMVENKITQDGTQFGVDLSFNKIQDFHPQNIVKQVPALQQLLAQRNLLQDLRASLLDNRGLRKSLETILKDRLTTEQLLLELQKIIPPSEEESYVDTK